MRDAACELDDFKPALHVALRVRHGLAVLGGEQFGEAVIVAVQQFEEFEHHARAALRVRRRPCGLRGLRVRDHLLDLGTGRERHMRLHFARRGIEDIGVAARCSLHVLAADEVPDLAHGVFLLC